MNKTVLYVDQHNHYGGGQQICYSVLDHLNKNDWNVVAMYPSGGNILDRVTFNFRYIPLPSSLSKDGKKSFRDYWLQIKCLPAAARAISAEIEGSACDLIYTGSPRFLPAVLKSAKKFRLPVIFHFEQLYRNRFWEVYLRHYLAKEYVCRLIFLSAYCKAWFDQRVGQFKKGIVIDNWLVSPKDNHSKQDRNLFPSSVPKSVKFAVIGRVLPIKGQETFVKAAIRLCQKNTNTEYYIIGDTAFGSSDYRNGLMDSVFKSSWKNRIHFIDHIDDVSLAYREVDCVVVPSVWDEPFGLVSIEAMYFKKALIVSDRGELPNIVGMGKYGHVFRGGDDDDLLSKMELVLESQSKTQNKIELARDYVVQKFSEAVQLPKIYREISNCEQAWNRNLK